MTSPCELTHALYNVAQGKRRQVCYDRLDTCKACQHYKADGLFSKCLAADKPILGQIRKGECPEGKWAKAKLASRNDKPYI